MGSTTSSRALLSDLVRGGGVLAVVSPIASAVHSTLNNSLPNIFPHRDVLATVTLADVFAGTKMRVMQESCILLSVTRADYILMRIGCRRGLLFLPYTVHVDDIPRPRFEQRTNIRSPLFRLAQTETDDRTFSLQRESRSLEIHGDSPFFFLQQHPV